MEKNNKKLYYKNSVGFFIIGFINSLSFTIIASSTRNLCMLFHAEQYNSLIAWFNIPLGLILTVMNMTILYKIKVKIRVIICFIFNVIGLFGMSLSIFLQEKTESEGYWYFGLCLCMILIIGGLHGFSQSVFLTYLGRFEHEMVNWWSSGTGFSGLGGTGLYLLLSSLEVDDKYIFISLIPLWFIYIVLFLFFIKPSDVHLNDEYSKLKEENEENGEKKKEIFEDEKAEEGSFWSKLKEALRQTWWLGLNIMLVLLCEGIINTGTVFVSVETEVAETSDYFFIKNYFEVLSFCFQIGTFLARSSLVLFKLKPVWILTIMQFILMLVMVLQGCLHFMVDVWGIWILMTIMLCVGLVGGCTYVQVMYWILQKDMKKETREIGLSFVGILLSLTILGASSINLLFNQTIWADYFSESSGSF